MHMLGKVIEILQKIQKPDELIALVSLLFVIIGGCFTLYQWNNSQRLKRAEMMAALSDRIRNDEETASILYMIDYADEEFYNAAFLDNHDDERKLDKALSAFNHICYLKNSHLIQENEFVIFKYRISRMASNEDLVFYLYNLYHFAKTTGEKCSFHHLIKYMFKENLIDSSFYVARELDEKHRLLNYNIRVNNSLPIQFLNRMNRSALIRMCRSVKRFYRVYILRK